MKFKISNEEPIVNNNIDLSLPNEFVFKEVIERTDSKGNLMYQFHFVPIKFKDKEPKTSDKGFKMYPFQQVVFTCHDAEGKFLYDGQKQDISDWCRAFLPDETNIVKALNKLDAEKDKLVCWVACEYEEDGEWNGKPQFKYKAKYFWNKKPNAEQWANVVESREQKAQMNYKLEKAVEQSNIIDDDDDLPF